jgi:hypothetical protein
LTEFDRLVSLTQKLLEVPAQLVETALRLELDDGAVVADATVAFLPASLLNPGSVELTLSNRTRDGLGKDVLPG